MKKSIVVIVVLMMVLSLTGCFPTEKNNYSSNNKKDSKLVSLNDVKKMEKHITEDIQDNLKIDADISIDIEDNASVLSAESLNIDYDKKWISNMCHEGKIIDRYGAEYNNDVCLFDNDTSTIKMTSPLGQYSYYFINDKEYSNRNIEWIYKSGNDFNGTINFEKDTIWKQNDLDFMTNKEARKLVNDKLHSFGIETSDGQAYAVDFKYIKKQEKWYNSTVTELEEKVHFTKNDEYYVVIPNIQLPNGDLLPQLDYWINADDDIQMTSAMVYGIVNKKGIIYLTCSGLFDNISKKEDNLNIVSFESAYKTIKDYYSDVFLQQPLTINQIKLAYVPYQNKDKEKTFELRPTWIFYVVKSHEDGTKTRCVKLVDAIDGHRVVFDQEDTF